MVPESVEPATTAARAGGDWQGQAPAPQEQNAELRIRNGHSRDGDRSCRVWPSLRQQQRTGRKGEGFFFFLSRLFSRSPSPRQTLAPRPQGLDAAAACWATCLPRTGGPQLAAPLSAAGSSGIVQTPRAAPLAGRQRQCNDQCPPPATCPSLGGCTMQCGWDPARALQ